MSFPELTCLVFITAAKNPLHNTNDIIYNSKFMCLSFCNVKYYISQKKRRVKVAEEVPIFRSIKTTWGRRCQQKGSPNHHHHRHPPSEDGTCSIAT